MVQTSHEKIKLARVPKNTVKVSIQILVDKLALPGNVYIYIYIYTVFDLA